MWILCIAAALAGAPLSEIPGLSAALPATKTDPAVAPAVPPPVAPAVSPVAPAPAPWAAELENAVVAAPSWSARRSTVTDAFATADSGQAARLGQVLAVLGHLERASRTDPSIVRLFVRAALADDPAVREAAVNAANAHGDPPTVAAPGPQPAAVIAGASVAPRRVVSAESLRAYKSRRLLRSGSTSMGAYSIPMASGFSSVGTFSVDGWKVTDGGGAPVHALSFARVTGDHQQLALFKKQKRTAVAVTVGAGIASAGLLIATVNSFAHYDPNAALWASASSLCVTFAVVTPIATGIDRRNIQRSYSPAEADARIETYNASIRTSLGLTDEDVLEIDLSTRREVASPTLAFSPFGVSGTF